MALITSISGIRGTIGGRPGEGLTPVDIVRFASAYATLLRRRKGKGKLIVVVGRDARISGPVVNQMVISTLVSHGIDVTDIGMASTPTVEVAVTGLSADGGIIITASHNPAHWNALKLLNEKGEFLSASDGEELLEIAGTSDFEYCGVDELGIITTDSSWTDKHIDMVLASPYVDKKLISDARLTVVADCVNSVGGIIVPELLRRLGVDRIVTIFGEPDGRFPHNPEPLPEHLTVLCERVVDEGADVGLVVDPDVDRLAIVCEDGTVFGEEYTLVAVADYILARKKGSVVSNMSSSMALRDIARKYECDYYSSPVGEVNVVEEMKRRNAVIGGEGNGGVIVPGLHYGRDAVAGIAIFLTHLAAAGISCSRLRSEYPHYHISKNKLVLSPEMNADKIFGEIRTLYPEGIIDDRDGIKVETPSGWVQVRLSNTEPILRIYAEAVTREVAERFINDVTRVVKKI